MARMPLHGVHSLCFLWPKEELVCSDRAFLLTARYLECNWPEDQGASDPTLGLHDPIAREEIWMSSRKRQATMNDRITSPNCS